MNATDIMTPDVICAAPDTPLPELVRLMLDHHISALPIVEDGHIVGIVTEGDLLHRAELGDRAPSVRLAGIFHVYRSARRRLYPSHAHKASETHDA